jgi:hypothetical protein
MPEKKNQHYVPQMHLRNFSTDIKGQLINVYHKKDKKIIYDIAINSQASEKYFYGRDGILEDSLGKLESKTSEIFTAIIEQNILPQKTSLEHFIILLYIIFSKFRTKKERDNLHKSQNIIFQKFFGKVDRLKEIVPNYEIFLEDPFWLLLGTAQKTYHLAGDLEFKLLNNATNKPFILSDNPTIFHNDFNIKKGKKITDGRGFASMGLQILFPLTSKQLLFFYDSGLYKLGTRKSRIVTIEDDKLVDQFNILQILNSNEVLFFNSQMTPHYLNNLMTKSFNYTPFDQQEPFEFFAKNNDQSILMMKRSNPNLSLSFNAYKLLDRAKVWKPDSRIVYYRSKWHEDEIEKIR